jgi:hypothetical protein
MIAQRRRLPIRDALHLADGRAWSVEADQHATGGLRVKDPFDVDTFVAEDLKSGKIADQTA